MVFRLIVDHLRRSPGPYVWCGLLLALIWPGVGAGMLTAGTGLAVSMAIAFYIGPLVTGVSFPPGPVLVLPVSSRQIWIAKWLLSTVAAAAWTTIAKLAGMGGAMALGGATAPLSLVALSALCDGAYTGAVIGMLPVLHSKPRGALAVRRVVLWGKMILAFLAATSVVWVFVLRDYLPDTWADLAGVSGAVMLAAFALTLTAVTWQYIPNPLAPRDNILRPPVRPAVVSADPAGPTGGVRAAARPRIRILNRFSGLGYLLWREAILWLLVAAGNLAGLSILVLNGPARTSPSATTELLSGFSLPLRAFPYLESGWIVLLVVSCFQALLPLPSPRLLRTLPLSTAGLNALVLAVPAVRWLMNVLAVSTMFVLLAGSLPPFHWGVLFWFLGLTALAHAIQLRSSLRHRAPATFLLTGVLAFALLARTRRLPLLDDFGMAYPLDVLVAGGVAVGAALLLNHLTLTRGYAIYRPAPAEPR